MLTQLPLAPTFLPLLIRHPLLIHYLPTKRKELELALKLYLAFIPLKERLEINPASLDFDSINGALPFATNAGRSRMYVCIVCTVLHGSERRWVHTDAAGNQKVDGGMNRYNDDYWSLLMLGLVTIDGQTV